MIFGIDIDDTISNTYEVIMAYAQEYTINFLKREPLLREELDCTNHMYAQYLHMWKDSDDKEFLANYYERLINNVRPKTLALEYLNKIHDEGNKIIIITARWKNDYFDIVEATKRWLERYNIPYDELITDADDKVGICKDKNIDIFIDDSLYNCKKVADAGIKSYIMDAIINRGEKFDNVTRVYSWPHLYMRLKEDK